VGILKRNILNKLALMGRRPNHCGLRWQKAIETIHFHPTYPDFLPRGATNSRMEFANASKVDPGVRSGECEAPVLSSAPSHQRVQITVIASEINHSSSDHGRRKDRAYALYFCDPGEHVVIEIGNIDRLVVRTSIGFCEG
jgi:hypothetical protein